MSDGCSPRIPLAVLLLLTVLGSTFAFLPAPVFSQDPSCGTTITTDTTLSASIGPCSDYGFLIGANGIVFDCAGHTIRGTGTNSASVGIVAIGRAGVTVKNCKAMDFFFGLVFDNSSSSTLAGNTASNNILLGFGLLSSSNNNLKGNTADGNAYGFLLYNSSNNTLSENTANSNTYSGFGLSGSFGNALSGNTADKNTNYGYDDTSSAGSGTAGTTNSYSGDECSGDGIGGSSPSGLCTSTVTPVTPVTPGSPTSSFIYTASPNSTSGAENSAPNSLFVGNSTLVTSGTVRFSFLGMGGNDTFDLYGGNASAVFLATGVLNNNFNVVTGNPATATNSSTFSLVSGANSTFNIIQNNFNGSVSFSIIAGSNSFVNDTSVGPVSDTLFSINLGANSTASIGSLFTGNVTEINVVY